MTSPMHLRLVLSQLHHRPVILLLAGMMVLIPRYAAAQETSPDCKAADLDVSYRFLNDPPHQTVVANLRDTSQGGCTLRSGAGMSFVDIRGGHSSSIKDCRNCDGSGNSRSKPPVTIAAGESAHLIVSW